MSNTSEQFKALTSMIERGEVEALAFAVIRTSGNEQSYEVEGQYGVIGEVDNTMATFLLGFTRLAEEDLIKFIQSGVATETAH